MKTEEEKNLFSRTELLVGNETMDKIASVRVILFGVGGVGGWCAESLVRSGVQHLTIVDSDYVSATNSNRQLIAMTSTLGQPKVEVLKKRLLDINPHASITAIQAVYSANTSDSFALDSYDYILDAIDSLRHKIDLLCLASKTNARLFSSMGAALRIDASKIQVAEFWKVKGCHLAAILRRKMRNDNIPAKKFLCVYSQELLENKGKVSETDESLSSQLLQGDNPVRKAQINGTVAHITAIFGFTLAGLVMQDICTTSSHSSSAN